MAKYDGTNWTTYNTSNSGLPNNNVYSLAIDSSDNTWIGTNGGGLAKFDGTIWTGYNASNSCLPNDNVISISIDAYANKWIGISGGGLVIYNEDGVLLNSSGNFVENRYWAYVYPNPASTELRVSGVLSGSENDIELYDVQGRIVQNITTKESETVLDFSHLPAGVYYCVVSNEKYRETVKVVKL